MAEWIGIFISGAIGIAGVALAASARKLAMQQDERAKFEWTFRAYPTGPTRTEEIALRFVNEGQASAWHVELDPEAFVRFAVVGLLSSPCVDPGDHLEVHVRNDPRAWDYPKRVRLKWRGKLLGGRRHEGWVDVKQWAAVAAEANRPPAVG